MSCQRGANWEQGPASLPHLPGRGSHKADAARRADTLMAAPRTLKTARTSGVAWPIDDAWKWAVRNELRRLGKRRADLARWLGVPDAAVALMFVQDTSRLVPMVHELLGWPPPTPVQAGNAAECPRLRTIQAAWPRLTIAQRQRMLELVKGWTRARPTGARG